MTETSLQRLLQMRKLVLASGSPRRIDLLQKANVQFRQITPQVDESHQDGEDPLTFARRVALEKATSVNDLIDDGEVALAGDTVVILDGEFLGKPADPDEARLMLKRLSGQTHIVCTALALGNREHVETGNEQTRVRFHKVTEAQIDNYVRGGEPLDKAGAYGIQGIGSFLVDSIEGALDNVVGLPFNLLYTLADRFLRRIEEGSKQS